MNLCIAYQSDGERFSWPWSIEGGSIGQAIAIVERIKVSAALGASYPRDPFEKIEGDQKICISYDPAADQAEVSVRNLTPMQALEGLCEAQYTMQLAWFKAEIDALKTTERSN